MSFNRLMFCDVPRDSAAVEESQELSYRDQFFWWCRERDRIRRRRERGEPWPWTDDPILREWKFTNCYRDMDAVSLDLKRQVLDRFDPWEADRAADLVFQVIAYRIFNWPATWRRLRRVVRNGWDEATAVRILAAVRERKDQIFTNAYNVSPMRDTRPKHETICAALTVARQVAPEIVHRIRTNRTLRNGAKAIQDLVPTCGGFVAYEIVCDLRWTKLLKSAPDIMTWGNVGPGATKGLNLIYGRPESAKPSQDRLLGEMQDLLRDSREPGRLSKAMRPFEMRDIEHSLCELKKYCAGRTRNRYAPPRISEAVNLIRDAAVANR